MLVLVAFQGAFRLDTKTALALQNPASVVDNRPNKDFLGVRTA
jgi:hypothetical protein